MRDEIINVYSSSGALIASFDNSIVDNAKNQKEKIYNPHISVDEDNSTATFEIFKDSNVWRTISSESEIYEIDGRRYFIYGEPSQISDDNLIRVTLKEIWNELDTQYVQAYNVKGDLEYIAEYTVSLVPFGGYPLVINGATKTNPFTRNNLGYYIWALLQGTGYSITQCNEEYCCDVVDSTYDADNLLSAYQLETEGLSVLENLKQLKELTDCIFKWDTVNKTLAVYDRNLVTSEQNKWQGYEIREGVNLKTIEKRKNTNITTRVIPYGSDNLTIASVNDGSLYLTDTSYSNKIYTKIINNPDIETPQALKVWAEKELNKMCRPTVEYEVDFVKRTDCEYAVESFNLYDIVRVVYFDKELNAEVVDDQRIMSLNYELWKESAFVAKLGDKHMRWEQKLKQSIKDSKKAGTVINSSGIISTGNIVHGKGTDKKYLDKVVESVYTSIGEIDAKATDNYAYVNLLALYANDTQGIKSAPTDTDKTLWDTSYTYYAMDSQLYYKFNSSTGSSGWEELKPIQSSIASISAKADANESSISSLTTWSSNLEIGGRNLLRADKWGSHDPYNTIPVVSGTNKNIITFQKKQENGYIAISQLPMPYGADVIYTASGIAKINGVVATNDTWGLNKTLSTYQGEVLKFTLDDNTGRFIITQKWTTDSPWIFHGEIFLNEVDDVITIEDFKFEKGNQATDWTPAPEDVDGAISAVVTSLTQISQKADANGAEINLLTEWQSGSKNKLNTNRNTEFNINRNPDEPIQFTEKMVIKGISFNGYIKSENINSYTMGTGTLSFSSANYSYGIGFPLKVLSGEKYAISANSSGIAFHVHFANANCMPISYVMSVSSFTVPNNAEWAVIIFVPSGGLNTTLTATNIQLEFGDISTGYAEYKESAVKALADVTQQADANGASIGLLATWKSGVESDVASIASISAKADANGVSIGLVVENDSVKGSVLVDAINGQSTVKINADKILLSGEVTIKDSIDGLGTGATKIKGNCIETGYIKSETYVAGSGNYSTDGMQISLDGSGYIRSKNFAIDGSGNAYFKGNADMVSGTIGSGTNKWNVGSSGLYYGISSLADATFIDGMYVGIDGFRNQKTYSYTYDTGTVDVENEVILLDGHIQLKNTIIEHDGIHGDTTYAHSGGLSTGELVLSSGGTMLGSTFSITTNGQVLGTIIKADDYDRIKITGPASPYKNTLYDDWIVDGTIQISTYDLATKITDIESRLLALEAVG